MKAQTEQLTEKLEQVKTKTNNKAVKQAIDKKLEYVNKPIKK